MILTKEIYVKIIPKTFKYFRNLGYEVNVNQVILIPIYHLNRRSRIKIEVQCDVCGKIKFLPHQKYTKSLDTYNYYSCSQKCSVGKCKNTFLFNYGFDSPLKNESIKEKMKNTKYSIYGDSYYNNFTSGCETKFKKYGDKFFNNKEKIDKTMIERYGVRNAMFLDEIKDRVKNSKIRNGTMLPDGLLSDFKAYKRNAMRVTRFNKKELFERWDGIDYYDGEFIYENLKMNSLDKKYPTIDHKISIYQGFVNNIDYVIIGGVENLCITKKFLNSKKGFTKKHNEFKSLIH
jgi:hypothetical protein